MTESSDSRRSWNLAGRSDADADLLQRSIAHVEHLLNRLEYGPAALPPETGSKVDAYETRTPEIALSIEGAIPPSGNATSPAAVGASPSAQTEALRVVLYAHDEANRIRAGAVDAHARAVAEGERLLVEARQLCEQVRTDVISEAAATADELRTAAQAEAEATKRDARNWADEQYAITECKARQRLDAAERDAEQVRRTARELAHAEAARQVDSEVRVSIAKAVYDAEAALALAHNTLSGALESLSNRLESLRQLATAMGPRNAPVGSAGAERQRRDDSDGRAGFDPHVLADAPTEASNGGSANGSGGAQSTTRQLGALFRTPRR